MDELRLGKAGLAAHPASQGSLTPARMPKKKSIPAPTSLKGWKAIAGYLGLTPATAQRWAEDGMPVKREGRFTVADPAELQAWLGRESHMAKPAHVMTKGADLAAALKESLAAAKREKKSPEGGSR